MAVRLRLAGRSVVLPASGGRVEAGMSKDDSSLVGLSPTVLEVIGTFADAMRADNAIDSAAVDRLERLLRQGSVPKPDEINAVLFEPPKSDAA